jgi:hypothetical protein
LEAKREQQALSLSRYTLVVSAVAASSLLVVWGGGLLRLDETGRWAALYGVSLAALNAVCAYSLVLWSDRRSTAVFLRAILWGTLGRMMALLAAVAVGIRVLDLPRVPLVVSLLLYFLLFFIMHTTIVHRRRPVSFGELP